MFSLKSMVLSRLVNVQEKKALSVQKFITVQAFIVHSQRQFWHSCVYR